MKRSFFVPEVVQTSQMDCGVACLKALLGGYGIEADLGRLREVCQTSVDGTSIDALEDVANQLGLRVEQRMLPAHHFFETSAACLPALVVMQVPGGLTHFVVAWRTLGEWVQVMDPASGRKWLKISDFMKDFFVHTMEVPAEDWRAWAAGDAVPTFAAQLSALGAPKKLLDQALADPTWKSLAILDASIRTMQILSPHLPPAVDRSALLDSLFQTGEDPDSLLFPPPGV